MNRFSLHIWLVACLLLLGACAREDIPAEEGRLYIRAASVDFATNVLSTTRSANSGYLTTFEDGDTIGVTGIDASGDVLDVCNNVWFVYHSNEVVSGVTWSSFRNARGYGFVEKVNGARYFAYYPYDPKWDGKDLEHIIANHEVLPDQSTKEAFNKSDLMTPDAAILPSGGELRFELKHKMATISLFYNNEWKPDGVTPLYHINLTSGTSPADLTVAHTYRSPIGGGKYELRRRYLVDPGKNPTVKIVGYLEEESNRYFSKSLNVERGWLYSVSFEGEPLVPYTDGVDLGLDDVPFVDRDGQTTTLGHTVIWSKYNLGESLGENYPFEPADGDRGARGGTRDAYARGDYYCWGATFNQYNNGISGYHGYGYNNYFDNEYSLAPLGGTIKETEYDVAHAKWWRGKWRLPTENEYRAMYAGCTFELVDSYRESNQRYLGIPTPKLTYQVIKVTSRQNGNSIYFATGGYTDGTMEPEKDAEGNYTESGDGKKNEGLKYTSTAYYLTSSASPTVLRCISYAYFNQTEQEIRVTGSRYTGMLVRPVYSPNEN